MYKNAEEMIKKEMNPRAYLSIANCFENAQQVYEDLLIDRADLFESAHIKSIDSRLFGFLIKRQFEPDFFPKSNGLLLTIKAVNKFGTTVTELRCNDLVMHIAKLSYKNVLPSKAKYKEEFCGLNIFTEKQLIYDTDDVNFVKPKEEPYYGFITYDIKNRKLRSPQLIIPNRYMSGILYEVNIFDKAASYGKIKIVTQVSEEFEAKKPILREDAQKALEILAEK